LQGNLSRISNIFSTYKKNLDISYNQILEKREKEKQKVQIFYKEFLNRLIVNYGEYIEKNNFLHIKEKIKLLFDGKDDISFVAIDGTSFKEIFSDFIVFSGGAYAIKGNLKLLKNDFKIEYKRWDLRLDKSIVSYLPIFNVELDFEKNEEMFFLDDTGKISFSNIHNQLMQLAEIYLAYLFSKDNSDVDLILIDNSLSSIYLSCDILHVLEKDGLNILDYEIFGNRILPADILITYAMPINEVLDVPSLKDFRGEFFILRKLFDKEVFENTKKTFLSIIRKSRYKVSLKHINRLKKFEILTNDSNLRYWKVNLKVLKGKIKDRWLFLKKFFEYVCEKLFEEKDINVLKNKNKWLNSNDLKFLVSLGLRLLMEEAWKNGKIIVGIAKDSSSKYFLKNYLGVMWKLDEYRFIPPGIILTDRELLEMLPFLDKNLKAPWSTIEFDSVFMSLHLDEDGNITGVRGDIIVPHERLFLRSLVQFYLKRNKKVLSSNVLFLDRLAVPKWDKDFIYPKSIKTIRSNEIKPLFFKDNTYKNIVQEGLIWVLYLLCRNTYPNVIGYPEPLHKADWGAKSLGEKTREVIKSSEIKFILDPLKKSFRTKREEGY